MKVLLHRSLGSSVVKSHILLIPDFFYIARVLGFCSVLFLEICWISLSRMFFSFIVMCLDMALIIHCVRLPIPPFLLKGNSLQFGDIFIHIIVSMNSFLFLPFLCFWNCSPNSGTSGLVLPVLFFIFISIIFHSSFWDMSWISLSSLLNPLFLLSLLFFFFTGAFKNSWNVPFLYYFVLWFQCFH